MLEGLPEHAAFAGDGDDAVVHRAFDIFRNLHLQARVNRLHLEISFFNQNQLNWKRNEDSIFTVRN